MDFYLIRHLTKFLYASQVSESLMEARMHPRSDNNQRCLSFSFPSVLVAGFFRIAIIWATTCITLIFPESTRNW